MEKGDLIHCDGIMDIALKSIELTDAGILFDVIIKSDEGVYDILVTRTNDKEII